MVVLRINNADLPDGWSHNKTDWQVATDKTFKNILAESMNDNKNLTTKIFNLKLDLGVKYYGRARMLLNTGFTEWSNIDVFIPKDTNEVLMDMDIPSVVSAPTLSTKFEKDHHPAAAFKIYGTNFSTLGNAEHISTTWIVEDNRGKAIWSSIDDIDNLTSITIPNILPMNTICRVHASYKGSNRDCSQFGTVSFYVSNDPRIDMPRVMRNVIHNLDLDIDIPFMNGLDTLEWELYINEEKKVGGKGPDCFFVIKEEYLKADELAILGMRVTINSVVGEWTYVYIIPRNEFIEQASAANIPYLNSKRDSILKTFPLGFPYAFKTQLNPIGTKIKSSFPLKLPHEFKRFY